MYHCERRAESGERRARRYARALWLSALCSLLSALVGCSQDMSDQPRHEPLEASSFFADRQSSRPLVPGAVARGQLRIDEEFFAGKRDGNPVEAVPIDKLAKELKLAGDRQEIARQVLRRGQERFDIFCAACHGRVGSGEKGLEGMVVQRGFPRPPAYYPVADEPDRDRRERSQRLLTAPAGHFFDVITQGFGRMPAHASKIPPADRWAIVAYVRALQFSQHVPLDQLPAEDQERLAAGAKQNQAGE
jgi:mono/diheme cytochrome c family protein